MHVFKSKLKKISLDVLESEKAVKQGLDFKFIDVQILILVTPAPTSQTAIFHRREVINQQTNISFSRLILCRVVPEKNDDGGAKLCYMIEAKKVTTISSQPIFN